MRLSEFWERMYQQFGESYADSLASDFVFARLQSRTVRQALDDGVEPKVVWRVVREAFRAPPIRG